MNAYTNPLTDSTAEDDPFANEVVENTTDDSGINLETHFPDGSPRPERLTEDTTYEEFLQWFDGSAKKGAMEAYYSHRPTTMNALNENSPGYERNEAGRYVNENGEALYYFTGPDYENEKKNGAGLNATADYLTGSEIKAAYDDDRVLQETFGSFDNYWSYINDRQNLIDSGQILDKWERSNQLWHDTFMRTIDGRGGPNGQYMADILEAERRRVEEAEIALNEQLAQQYGIETNITDTNGNTLRWNGSGYSLIERYKEDDKWGRQLTFAAAGMILSAGLAPMLTGALGAAGGKAAASAITDMAMQYMQNGEVDWGKALTSAALAYGGESIKGMVGDWVDTGGSNIEWTDELRHAVAESYVAEGAYSSIQEALEAVDDIIVGGGNGDSLIDQLLDMGIDVGKEYMGGDDPSWQPNDASTQGSGGWVQDPETGEWSYDPSAVQIQYPDYNSTDEAESGGGKGGQDDGGGTASTTDTDGDGIPDDVDEYPNDPTNTPEPSGGGQYEVVKVNPDGTVIVKDNVDGDVWIVKGDYKVGDILTEEVMTTNTVGSAGPDWDTGTNTDTATDTDGDGIADADDPWPNIPNLPGIDPTVPGNKLPDGTEVPTPKDPNVNEGAADGDECDHISEDGTIEKGVIKDGYCTLTGAGTNPTPTPNPDGVEEGAACEIGGQAGTIQGGKCVPNSDSSTPGEGDPCSLPDGTMGTIQGGVCTSGDSTGGGTSEGDACTLADGSAGTIQGGVCKGTGDGGGDDEGDGDDGDGTCTLPDGTTGTLDENGVCRGDGNGDGDGDGDGDGNGRGVGGMLSGGGGAFTPKWGPMFQDQQWRSYQKQPRAELLRSLWNDVMK